MCRTPSETVVGARTDLTLHEISGHKTREDCWLIIDEKVYDVSDWISRHPGGEQILLMYAGTDATDVFKAFHHPREFKRLSAYHVGNLKHGEIHPSEGLKDFRKLNSELWEQGHFEPVLNFHYKIFAIAMSLMVACIMLLKIASMPTTSVASRYILVGTAGLCLAQFWQQSLLIAHDACHTGITRKRKVDVLLGQLFGTLGAGIGATWWTKDHNEHHAVTNQVERERGGDRTAGALPVLTVHELQLEWELRDQGKGARKGQQLWYWALLQLQYFLYAPIILIVARFNLHIISVVLAEKNMRLVLDMFLMAGFGVVTYGVCSMAPEGFRLGFYAVAHVSVSVLHMIIAMNHFHMPMYNEVYKPEDGGWLKHQLHTTSNISGGAFMNWYCGGLQCQVEHHLFPQMPRARLVKLKPVIKALCKKHGIRYQEFSFWRSNMLVLDGLWRVAKSPMAQLSLAPGSVKTT